MTAPEPLTPAQRAGCIADMIGVPLGLMAAIGIMSAYGFHEWMAYEPSGATITDAQYYTGLGAFLAVVWLSYRAARTSALLRIPVVAGWVSFLVLLAAKNVGMLLGM